MDEKRERVHIDSELLLKYFNRTAGKEEEKRVESWFNDPAYETVLKYKLKELWDQFDVSTKPDVDSKKILDRVYHQIFRKEWETERKSFVRRAYHLFSRVAAILIIPLMVFVGWYMSESVFTKDMSMAEIYSPLGARTQFILPDGSKGWLNSGSSLKFPVKFTGKRRKVMLRGEGYFDVVKNPKKPFVVNAKNIDVIALGTKFDVMAYPGQKVDVVLKSGHVVVNKKTKKNKNLRITELLPGEMVTVYVDNNTVKKQKCSNPDIYSSWKEGKLVFRNDPMPDVIEKINRWYNVNVIILDDEIMDYKYRATFDDETLDDVLKMLKITSPIDYYEVGRKVKKDGVVLKRKIYLFLKKNKNKYLQTLKNKN